MSLIDAIGTFEKSSYSGLGDKTVETFEKCKVLRGCVVVIVVAGLSLTFRFLASTIGAALAGRSAIGQGLSLLVLQQQDYAKRLASLELWLLWTPTYL